MRAEAAAAAGCRENYIHRIGRSGRFGRKGVAINFVTAVRRPFPPLCLFRLPDVP